MVNYSANMLSSRQAKKIIKDKPSSNVLHKLDKTWYYFLMSIPCYKTESHDA